MTREEAIEYLNTISSKLGTVEILEYCRRDDDKMRKAIEALDQTRWIPCIDRLPEDGIYLVTVERIAGAPRIETKSFAKDLNRVDDFSFRKHKCGWYDYDSEYGCWEDVSVIAWMPLPKPYDPQEREDAE